MATQDTADTVVDAAATAYVPITNIKSIAAICTSSYNLKIDTCSICRSRLDELCVQCSSEVMCDEQKCIFVTGACGHIYHNHCIGKWLTRHTVCPLCNIDWEAAQYSDKIDVKK